MASIKYNRDALMRWYNEHSANYDKESFIQNDNQYGGDLYRIALVADLISSLKPKRILDIGCGTAEPMLKVLKNGFDVRGFDLSPGMIEQAKKKLKANGFSENLAEVGDVLDPSIIKKYGANSFDLVIANGVLPYISDSETAHKHISQLIKPNGYYASAYSNALLDLVTFNRFTMRFHWENFISPLKISEDEKKKVMEELEKLITHPYEPKSIPEGARNDIYVGSHNPLTLKDEIKKYGLIQEDIFFYKFHAFPPILKGKSPMLHKIFMQQSRSYEIAKCRDWRGYFLASTFIVVAKKNI